MRWALAIAIATALGAAPSSSIAVMLSSRGTGQVLIYPYYTINHQATLVSVINTTAHGKALKVRFREGYDGRDVANFNVYLSPYDSWVGGVGDFDGTGAVITTNDYSCTVPAFPLAGIPDTLHPLPFSNANYSQGDYGTPTGTDSGPADLERTREGFFEIIEMGEVVDQSTGSQKTLEAITPVNGTPPGCAQVQNAWANGGYWTTNPTLDLLPPAGGIYGAAGIVDVAQGTLYAYDATAIDGFSDVVQHTGPGDAKPNLSTAVTDSALDIATAYVPIGNAMIKADYPASTRGVDAVSAVLMADTLYNEFDIEPQLGAASDWLITFPTKQFYVDPAIVGTTVASYVAPFAEVFGGGLNAGKPADPEAACVAMSPMLFFDREGTPPAHISPAPLEPPNYVCYQTQVVPIVEDTVAQEPYVAVSRALGSNLAVSYFLPNLWILEGAPRLLSGNLQIGFAEAYMYEAATRPAANGNVFRGLPVIGFAAINYINANVTPGVLSNYSALYPHRSSASCTNSTNPQGACQ